MPLSDVQLMDRLNARRSPAGALLGAEVVEVDSEGGTMRVRYVALAEWRNPMGGVQGGFVAAMLDEAAGLCALAHARRRIGLPTLEFKVSFMAALKPGPCEVTARVLRMGKRAAFAEADLIDGKGVLCARMTSTAMPVELSSPVLVERDGDG